MTKRDFNTAGAEGEQNLSLSIAVCIVTAIGAGFAGLSGDYLAASICALSSAGIGSNAIRRPYGRRVNAGAFGASVALALVWLAQHWR